MNCCNSNSIIPAQTTRIRNSNIELYRITVMILIISHHYVVHSGLFEILKTDPIKLNSLSLILFGGWGKIGVNCFVLITGYFMCKSNFTWSKLRKLYMQFLFYSLLIYGLFVLLGIDTFNFQYLVFRIFPIKYIQNNFVNCFLIFFLFIPFINILINNLNKKLHEYLILLLVLIYSVLPNIPIVSLSFNYIEWFFVVYIIASYFRIYEASIKLTHKQWGVLALGLLMLCSFSIFLMCYLWYSNKYNIFDPYFFISDSNKLLAIGTALSIFMWFKGIKMRNYKLINMIGATTFGVLLIHDHSLSMQNLIWNSIIEGTEHFDSSIFVTMFYAIGSVLIIFTICSIIDLLRLKLFDLNYLKDYKMNFLIKSK